MRACCPIHAGWWRATCTVNPIITQTARGVNKRGFAGSGRCTWTGCFFTTEYTELMRGRRGGFWITKARRTGRKCRGDAVGRLFFATEAQRHRGFFFTTECSELREFTESLGFEPQRHKGHKENVGATLWVARSRRVYRRRLRGHRDNCALSLANLNRLRKAENPSGQFHRSGHECLAVPASCPTCAGHLR